MQGAEPAAMATVGIAIGIFAFGTRKSWWPVFVNGADEIIDGLQMVFETFEKVGLCVWHGTLLEFSQGKSRVSDAPDHDSREKGPATERARAQYVRGEIDERELEGRLEEAMVDD